MKNPHQVEVWVGNPADGWVRSLGISDYAMSIDILTAADAFSLRFPFRVDLWDAATNDNQIQFIVDGATYVHGIIERRQYSLAPAESITINARDIVGRLVDESAPLLSYDGLGIVDLIRKCLPPPVGGLAVDVVTSNTTNRKLISRSGRGRDVDPPIFTPQRVQDRKVNAGESVWHVISHFLEEAKLLLFATGDGSKLVVAPVNRLQVPIYQFIYDGPGAPNNNVLGVEYDENVTDCYSMITAMGRPRDDEGHRSKSSWRSATWYDNPKNTVDGTGKRFRRRKQLIVTDDGATDMRARAEREAAERDVDTQAITVYASGHAQEGPRRAYYAPDTLAFVSLGRINVRGIWYCTAIRLTQSDADGQRTELSLVPRDTDIRMGS